MRVDWVNTPHFAIAGGYGYAVANSEMHEAVQQAGVTLDPDSPVALYFTSPQCFNPRDDGKLRVLFTMWESARVPQEVSEPLLWADVLVVPSRFCVEILRPYFNGRIYRCPLGVHPDKFPYRQRSWSPRADQPFRWLMVGASSFHKGWDVLEHVWSQAAAGAHNCELYLKTTGDVDKLRHVAAEMGFIERERDVWQSGNVIFDGRNLPVGELCALYHSAHGFAFLTGGEGWGLTLQEAMSTGLPCIATNYSGHLDYANHDNCYLVDWHPVRATTEKGLVVDSAFANPRDVARAMFDIMADYRKALRKGKRASRDMKRFSWQYAGKALARILERIAVKRAA